jgi:O-succinylbenzoic acid--CoA ligase
MNIVVQTPSSNPLRDLSERIDFASLVPLQLASLSDEDFKKIDSIRSIIIGGAPLSEDIADKLQHSRAKIYATYASTETISHVALQKINGPDRQDFFQLLPGIEASTDERNCLVVRASHLGKVVTNDIVDLFDKNKFKWLGRYDEVINTGGVKVNAGKVEKEINAILKDLGIRNRIFVGGLPDPKLGEQVTLFVETGGLDTATENILKTRMQEHLDKYEQPKAIIYVPHFAETASQKIDRRASAKMIG